MRMLRAVLAAGLVVLATAAPASAQSGERILRYAVGIDVAPSGRLHVTERIVYDFGSTPRHGIYLYLRVRARYDKENDRVWPVKHLDVTGSGNTPTRTKTSHEGNNLVIRIGDPKTTITGRHEYVIQYDVDAAIDRYEDHDELYWNAIGDDWAVPIDEASVVVRAEAPLGHTACFAGQRGSSRPCDVSTGSARLLRAGQQRTMLPYSGITVVVDLPHGYAARPGPKLTEHRTLDKAFARSPLALGLAGALLVLGFGTFGVLLRRNSRDRRYSGEIPGLDPGAGVTPVEEPVPLLGRTPVSVEFSPDRDMRPAIMGVLLDEKADPLDTTATLVDLAVRGHLTITEQPRHGLFGKRDWLITRVDPAPADHRLVGYENEMLAGIGFPGTDVTISELKRTFSAHHKKIQDGLYDEVVSRGWFTRRPDRVRGRWFAGGVFLAGAGVGITALLATRTHLGLVGLPVVLTGALVMAFHRRMPARTARGTAALVRTLGFKRYLSTAEAEQLREHAEAGVFERYLPYAVVLGETERWAKVFHDLGGDQRAPGWYSGPSGWSSAHFADSMSDFATMTAGSFAASASGSGHSGGSVGGGGGGGGGGSW